MTRVDYYSRAQQLGISFEYRCLQSLRKGVALASPDRLLELPPQLRDALGLPGEPALDDLAVAMKGFVDAIAGLSRTDQLLAVITWNLGSRWRAEGLPTPPHDPGDDWLVRCQKAAEDARLSWVDESSIRRQSDRVVFELLLALLGREGVEVDAHAETVAVVGTGPRREGERRTSEPVRSPASELFSESYVDNSPAFRDAMRRASTLSLLGYSHNRMAVTYAAALGRMLEDGGRLRILMLDPDDPIIFDANERSYAPKAHEDVRHQHEAAAATLAAIAKRARPGCFELRLIKRLPPFTIYLFDEDDSQLGQAFVWLTPWRRPSSQRPGFHLTAQRDAEWYPFFRDQVQALWEHHDPSLD